MPHSHNIDYYIGQMDDQSLADALSDFEDPLEGRSLDLLSSLEIDDDFSEDDLAKEPLPFVVSRRLHNRVARTGEDFPGLIEVSSISTAIGVTLSKVHTWLPSRSSMTRLLNSFSPSFRRSPKAM